MTQAQPLHFQPSGNFQTRSRAVLDNPALRTSFVGAMDFLRQKRETQFPDPLAFSALRDQGEAIRRYALENLPALLEQLETRLVANGFQVHWAEDVTQAQQIISELVLAEGADLVVKGKSMVSEEIELNQALAAQGVNALESDMGEYIVQLAGERPSHIIMPAIHKTREEIARLFAERIPGVTYTDAVDELIGIGRQVLRQAFRTARIGLSGVNMAVAETGTLCLVENEGNGRMCTTVPDMHIALMGIEKVVEKLAHVPPLLTLLTRSATGQAVTTYFNWISGPRRPGEQDGPKVIHLVLVDNGRSQAYARPDFRATLQCIRCGACMNHCPVYARIGGLAYGTTYPGPIGTILSPHLLGLENSHELLSASSLCGACGEVCPVGIPIPELLIDLRARAQAGGSDPYHPPLAGTGRGRSWQLALALGIWSAIYRRPWLYRLFALLITRLRNLTPAHQGAWTRTRTPLQPAPQSLHAWARSHQTEQQTRPPSRHPQAV